MVKAPNLNFRKPTFPEELDDDERITTFGDLMKYAFIPQFLLRSKMKDVREEELGAVATFQVNGEWVDCDW